MKTPCHHEAPRRACHGTRKSRSCRRYTALLLIMILFASGCVDATIYLPEEARDQPLESLVHVRVVYSLGSGGPARKIDDVPVSHVVRPSELDFSTSRDVYVTPGIHTLDYTRFGHRDADRRHHEIENYPTPTHVNFEFLKGHRYEWRGPSDYIVDVDVVRRVRDSN